MNHSFEAYYNSELIFYSDRNWLHPIFEFEEFLKTISIKAEAIHVQDKIIGRAAALLLVRLGIGEIEAKILSELGRRVLEYFETPYSYEELVDRIGCETENILENELDPKYAYQIILKRIKK
ncbi:MAG TPA: DUF1893 domain-containing protein [Calditrichaeota bacterium]|nr:DUF1893 domain-containing protein [Calditrichota bacterium]